MSSHKRVHSWHGISSREKAKEIKEIYGISGKKVNSMRSESENSKSRLGSTQNRWFINFEDNLKKKEKSLDSGKNFTLIKNTKSLLLLSKNAKILKNQQK